MSKKKTYQVLIGNSAVADFPMPRAAIARAVQELDTASGPVSVAANWRIIVTHAVLVEHRLDCQRRAK